MKCTFLSFSYVPNHLVTSTTKTHPISDVGKGGPINSLQHLPGSEHPKTRPMITSIRIDHPTHPA